MTSGSDGGASDALIGRGQVTGVGLSSLFSAAVSYVVLLIAAQVLTPSDNAIFLTYWALLFGTFGVITGLNPEAARAGFEPGSFMTHGYPRIVPTGVGFGAALCAAIGISAVLWADLVLDPSHAWLVAVVAVAGASYSGQLAAMGVLAGRRQWRGVIGGTLCEASVRIVAVVVAVLALGSLSAIACASAVPALAWLLLLGRRDLRGALRARGDGPLRAQLGNFGHAAAASASSAALLVGFPVLIRLTTDRAEYLGAAGLLLAISLTRAPLMVPLTAYQGVALTHFLRHRRDGVRALFPIAGAIVGVTAVAAGLAALVGPQLFSFLLGGRYTVSSALLAALTTGAGLLGLLTVTGACCLAVGGHRAYAAGWLLSTGVALAVLLLPIALEARTALSLILGPVAGAVVHGGAVRAASAGSRTSDVVLRQEGS